MDLFLRYGTLAVLVVQTTATVLLLRYSRTRPGHQPYLASTAVLSSEMCKLAVCLFSLFAQCGMSLVESARFFVKEIVMKPGETLKLVVPSSLYCLQNNLLFLALTNLDAATYQVTYQLKILTTALFSVCLLRKHIKPVQWVALFILALGVALVQMPGGLENEVEKSVAGQDQFVGLAAVLCACFSSGFAGVFFEKLVKTGAQQSVVIRNLQLGMFSVLFAAIAVIYNDMEAIALSGYFQGYDIVVYTLVMLQAFGGLVVALTVKYADNILKGFATSISIVASSIFSFLILDDLSPGGFFVFGATLVIAATFMYGSSSVWVTRKISA